MTPNAIFRFRARTALKNNWQIALLVVFIASLPSILTQVVGVLTGGDMSSRLMTLMEDPAFLSADADAMIAQLTAALTGEGTRLYALCSVVAWLVAPMLTLGLYHYMMGLLRGQPGEISTVFSRAKCFFRALCLTILTALKTFLWAVPGMALAIGGTTAAATMFSDPNMAVNMMLSVMSVGYMLMFGLMIAAMLRYAMAPYVLADEPSTGVLQCIRRSKELMKGRKMQLFALEFSFLIWNALVMLAYMLLSSMFGYVIGLTVQMFLNLFVSAYQHCAITAFFLQYQEGGELQAEAVIRELTENRDENPWNRDEE